MKRLAQMREHRKVFDMKRLAQMLVTSCAALFLFSSLAFADAAPSSDVTAINAHAAHYQLRGESDMGLFKKPQKGADQAGGESLARLDSEGQPVFARTLTLDLAQKFAAELLSDPSHSVESASNTVGIRAGTVREAIRRFEKDKCGSPQDEQICTILASAKTKHIHQLRNLGFGASVNKANGPGASWIRWQLEVQDPVHHPRKLDVNAELTGPGGGPIRLGVGELSTDELLEIVRETDPE